MNKQLLVLVASGLLLTACSNSSPVSSAVNEPSSAKTTESQVVDNVASGEYKFAYEFKRDNEAYQRTYVPDWSYIDPSGEMYPKLQNDVLASLKHDGLTTLKLEGNNYTLTKSLVAKASSINIEFEFKGTAVINGLEVKLGVPSSATALEEIGGGMGSHGVVGNYPTKTSSADDPRILDFFNTPYINYVRDSKAEQTLTVENANRTLAYADSGSVTPQPGPGPSTDVTIVASEQATLGEHTFKIAFFSDGKYKVTMDDSESPLFMGSWSVNAETHSITIENGQFNMDQQTRAASVTFDLQGNSLVINLSMETLVALNQNGGAQTQPQGPTDVTTIATEQATFGDHALKLEFFSDGKYKLSMDDNPSPIAAGTWSVNAETHSITIENATFAMDPETRAASVTFVLNGNNVVINLSMETLVALNQNGGAQQQSSEQPSQGEVEAVVVSAVFNGQGPDSGKTYNLSIKKDKTYAVSCEGQDKATGTWSMSAERELVFNQAAANGGEAVSYTSKSNEDHSKSVTMNFWNSDIVFVIPAAQLPTIAGYLAA